MKHLIASLWTLSPSTSVAALTLFLGCYETSQAGEIHDAVKKGDVAKVATIISADPYSINSKGPSNATPLILATYSDQTEIAKLLIEKGADIHARSSTGHTALFSAAVNGELEVVKLMLEKGAQFNFDVHDSAEGDDPGSTPLLMAAENGHLEVVKLLLAKGANVNAKSSYNTTHQCASPLIGATKVDADYGGGWPFSEKRAIPLDKRHGYLEVVTLLLDNKANIDFTDNFGHTALFYAAKNRQAEVVQLLLQRGAGADLQGHNRNGTPLLFASQNGDAEIVKLLLAKGADPNAELKTSSGKVWTPISVAEANGFTEVVELLRKVGKPKH